MPNLFDEIENIVTYLVQGSVKETSLIAAEISAYFRDLAAVSLDMEPSWHLLLLFLLVVTGFVSIFVSNKSDAVLRNIYLATTSVALLVSTFFVVLVQKPTLMTENALAESKINPDFAMNVEWLFSIVVDGISAPLIILTTACFFICALSIGPGTQHLKGLVVSLLLLEFAILGSFLAADLLSFFIFFEISLVPVYFIVLVWGSRARRVRAGYFLAIYTLFGSVFLFVAILYIMSKVGTTDLDVLNEYSFEVGEQRLLWLALFISFAVKIPLWPLHIWLPEAHVEAPTLGSVLLAVLMLKLGTYGLLRFSLPLFPAGTYYFAPIASTLAILGVIFTGLTAIRQTDAKKIIAYSSVGHMGAVILGILSRTPEGLAGSIFQMISHGIVSGALFLCIGVLYDRYGVRSLHYFGGLAGGAPIFAAFFLLFSLANMGLPMTSNFVGEFLLLLGTLMWSFTAAVLAATTMVLGACYSLWAYNRIAYGNLRVAALPGIRDVTRREFYILMPLVVAMFWLGLAPAEFLSYLSYDVAILRISTLF